MIRSRTQVPPGTASFDLPLGPVRLRLLDLPTSPEPFVSEHYAPFAEPAGSLPADLTISCRAGEGTVILVPAPGATPVIEVKAAGEQRYTIRSHWQEGSVDFATGRGELTLTDRGETEFRMSVENFLRVAGQLLLLRRRAFLMHTAGILEGGRCHLFFGHSGAGKSTATALSEPRRALSDDMVLLDLAGPEVQAHAVPFYGLYPLRERMRGVFPVAGAFRLRQASEDRLVRLPPARAAATVAASVPFVADMGLPPQQVTDLALELCRRLPVFDLHFTRSPRFWDLIAACPEIDRG